MILKIKLNFQPIVKHLIVHTIQQKNTYFQKNVIYLQKIVNKKNSENQKLGIKNFIKDKHILPKNQ